MHITVTNAGKRYNNWVFRNISLEFKSGEKYAILGPNGSGKSTLLRAVSGSLTLTEGTVSYKEPTAEVATEYIYKHVTIAAPYLDIPEEYTLPEIIAFHKNFKPVTPSVSEVISRMELEHTGNRLFKHFSSGMKQRVKLGLAIMTDVPVLLLDEPSTALDANAIKWYQELINEFAQSKTILVFSNNKPEEYTFCKEVLAPFKQDIVK